MAKIAQAEEAPRAHDFITELPPELAVLVLSQLGAKDLLRCSGVSRAWRSLTVDNNSLYVPHLVRKYNHTLHGRDAIPARNRTAHELLQRFPRLSASPYLDGAKSPRELALRDLRLLQQWRSGTTRRVNLNRSCEHTAIVLSVLIDPVYNLIITGDKAGKVVFWSTHTERALRSVSLRYSSQPYNSSYNSAVSAMALDKDYLVIGTWQMVVHVLKRDSVETPISERAFSPVAQFPVYSEVVSILLEDQTCIVGCADGAIAFWDIGAVPVEGNFEKATVTERLTEQYNPREIMVLGTERDPQRNRVNLSMHYKKPFLFTSSHILSLVCPRKVDPDNRRDLWEYEDNKIRIKQYSPPGETDDNHLCLLHPVRGNDELLVAWPDMTISILSAFKEHITFIPEAQLLLKTPHTESIRSLATGDGIFVTGSFDHSVGLFSETGQQLQMFNHGGDVTCVAVDPCFIVSVSDDRSVMLWDFTPPLPFVADELKSSPSPSLSATSSEPSTTPPSSPDSASESNIMQHS